ncbi:TetR/AcrR family transcriptional regulator [Streptomyces sp. RB6PN25]|uniref:TetR/AcrR family transcriptional regulator n=1 Tax=Streptomyces humicola TaxID=2953240 RepID=A0ABT1PRQ8_9ACTN|nr:TetR/AcrR family transcriptional regulator [Streptomyces humicola]MCQ4079645.1 TetR/AcrR family transcriptional regulator [Streptomyces humicola]
MGHTDTATPHLRADARRNRERILVAARDIFTEQGPDAPLDEIARRAGVGNATLYRHFGDREDLIREVTLHVIGGIADDAEAALAGENDPFEALRRFLHAAADRRIGAVLPSVRGRFAENESFWTERARGIAAVTEIMHRARASGQLRPDVELGDIWVVLTQLTRPLPGSDCTTFAGHVGRHVELFAAGLRAPAPHPLPGSSYTLSDPASAHRNERPPCNL